MRKLTELLQLLVVIGFKTKYQYHQGTINTPWKYLVLEYIYEKKLMSASEIIYFMTEINKTFPWLNIKLLKSCYKGTILFKSTKKTLI